MHDPDALDGPDGRRLSQFCKYDFIDKSIVEGIALGITEVYGFHLRPVNGSHAHRARFGRTVDYAAGQVGALNMAAGIPNSHDLCMAGGA